MSAPRSTAEAIWGATAVPPDDVLLLDELLAELVVELLEDALDELASDPLFAELEAMLEELEALMLVDELDCDPVVVGFA